MQLSLLMFVCDCEKQLIHPQLVNSADILQVQMTSSSSTRTDTASDTIFSSSSIENEKRWVKQIRRTLDEEHVIDINTPVCVFHVPKTISSVKPEAYAPQKLGLGPYHHFQPHLYEMVRHKLAAVKRFVKQQEIHDFQQFVVAKLNGIEPTIRACYDQYLDLDGNTLAWMLAIDGLYFLDLLLAYRKRDHIVDSAGRKLAQDIMMSENQIPFILLKEIRKAISVSHTNDLRDISSSDSDDEILWSEFGDEEILRMYYVLSKAHSPLELTEQSKFKFDTRRMHLLDYMYYWIVNNRGIKEVVRFSRRKTKKRFESEEEKEEEKIMEVGLVKNIGEAADVAKNLGIGVPILQAAGFITKLPWDKILSLWRTRGKPDETGASPPEENTIIPSASELSKIAGVKFRLTTGGFRDIKFDGEKLTLSLPAITPNVDSDVILRNLVAHEANLAASGSCTFELAVYIDMMCGLIQTAEDVKLLRKEGIVKDGLTEQKVANMFNGIIKSGRKSEEKSDLEKTIDEVNARYYSRLRVKARTCLMKQVSALLKFLAFLSAVLLLLLLILQALCQVYDCSSHWFGKSSESNLGFALVSSLLQKY